MWHLARAWLMTLPSPIQIFSLRVSIGPNEPRKGIFSLRHWRFERQCSGRGAQYNICSSESPGGIWSSSGTARQWVWPSGGQTPSHHSGGTEEPPREAYLDWGLDQLTQTYIQHWSHTCKGLRWGWGTENWPVLWWDTLFVNKILNRDLLGRNILWLILKNKSKKYVWKRFWWLSQIWSANVECWEFSCDEFFYVPVVLIYNCVVPI